MTTRILAIDPGYTRSAWLVLEGDKPAAFGILENEELLVELRHGVLHSAAPVLVIEKFEGYGMVVGRETFDTIFWAGRFAEAVWPAICVQMPRRAVKIELCGVAAARDSNVRWALLDRFGGSGAAVGTKAAPGPLYGIHKDVWSALGIAVTFAAREARAAA